MLSCGDGIARVYGLDNADGRRAARVPARRLRDGAEPRGGQRRRGAPRRGPARSRRATRSSAPAASPRCRSATALLGRVVNALGQPIDGKGPIARPSTRRIELKAPGVVERQPVKEPLQTGIKAIDSMIPIGRGQRELIIGDRQTGKTAIALDTIINQKGTERHLHLRRDRPEAVDRGAGGRDARELRRDGVHHRRRRHGLRAGAAAVHRAVRRLRDGRVLPRQRQARAGRLRRPLQARRGLPPALAAAAPPAGPRGVSRRRLLPALPPARARRQAARRSSGGGSLTALPIIETQAGDVSAYIPTNVISITDGQIFLETDLFYSGRAARRSTSGISVSRVGGYARSRR